MVPFVEVRRKQRVGYSSVLSHILGTFGHYRRRCAIGHIRTAQSLKDSCTTQLTSTIVAADPNHLFHLRSKYFDGKREMNCKYYGDSMRSITSTRLTSTGESALLYVDVHRSTLTYKPYPIETATRCLSPALRRHRRSYPIEDRVPLGVLLAVGRNLFA